ncbi:hypothetical protein INT45_004766 [Circinella minor]|uniref:Exonuclease domain-containing protein n=1 Tax=Circinella minor TaxID=1195481 RepID=A0A8H7VUM8_9FUNG|nr:hypothetical protein INT45_004766 [Circinella minor]
MMAATSTAAAAPKRVTNLSRSIINNKSNNNNLNSLLKPASSSSLSTTTAAARRIPPSTSISRPITTTTKNISSASSSSTSKTTGPIKTGVGIQPSMSSVGGSRRMAHKASFNVTATGPPNIVPTLNCHAPLKMRQLISQRLYEQFLRIYQPILSNHPTLATEHTKSQESFILEKTSNQAGYKQMATNILMNLKKRPEALNDQDMGIDGEWEDPITKEQQKVITLTKVTKCILSTEEMEKMGYPLITIINNNKEDEKRNGGETIGSKKICDRCKKEYIVKDVLQENDLTLCQFHHGKMRMVMNRGEKLRQYTCCDESYGSMGCAKGPHVYKDENVQDLHAKIPFISTPEGGSAKNKRIVVALDCEMAYTTAGMELVRLTAIDEHCKVLLDELVFPSHMVIDLNTRYSGIKTLAGARHNLDSVRKELFKYVDANTILLGHGLENDMNALRLIHPKIIDTAALYPHPKGLPYRYGLRVLSTKILQKFIQDSTEGHDSFEDAKTCVDLLEKYLKSPQGQKL